MADEETPAPEHNPPSLPASPLPKRTKYSEPAPNLTVACEYSPYACMQGTITYLTRIQQF